MSAQDHYHQDNGPWVRGVPEKMGRYWFMHPMARGVVCPCVVIPEGRYPYRAGVRMVDGWGNPEPEGRFALDHHWVVDSFFAPMAPPARPET